MKKRKRNRLKKREVGGKEENLCGGRGNKEVGREREKEKSRRIGKKSFFHFQVIKWTATCSLSLPKRRCIFGVQKPCMLECIYHRRRHL
jgi:hypothetical protein